MPTRAPAAKRSVVAPRGRLLLGVSLVAMTAALGAGRAHAQTMGALLAATHQAIPAAVTAPIVAPTPSSGNAAMNAAAARALRNQTQVNQTLSLAAQAQAAARAAALAMKSPVPDGLKPGGLVPVAKPVLAAADPTGLNTWQGAKLPTASAKDPNQVTIVQTDPHAVLSWQTFNVGANTTLTFQQQKNGVAQPSWVALNRVVGQINPATGLRDPSLAPAPSQILGHIKADGTVLVLNQNGVIFGATAQVNVGALVATSLEIGHAVETVNGAATPIGIAQRNAEFLQYGLLGYADQAPTTAGVIDTFSAQQTGASQQDPLLEGAVQVEAGATIDSASGGFVMLIAPRVENAGALTSNQGEVALQSGRNVQLTASHGDATSVNPDVRGLVLTTSDLNGASGDYVENTATGTVSAPEGFVSIGSTVAGAVINAGALSATTSVSRNGYIALTGADIQLSPGSLITITPDDSPATIPQDSTSLQAFKSSRIDIGATGSRIDIGANSLIYAPSANISIGSQSGSGSITDAAAPLSSRVFVDDGAVIDAAGLTDVIVPASRNAVEINPVTNNALADSPALRSGFLDGAKVYVDPRLSGVDANGVAWVGSPLISAAAYAQQVGVSASELMTKGGNVTLGVLASSGGANSAQAPDVIVKAGASIDISGGWKTYQAGLVKTTNLVDASGQVVDIGHADPNDTYIAVYNGFTVSHPRWGITQTYTDPVLNGGRYEGQYTEGLDAGSLTLKGSAVALDGKVFAAAYAGSQQLLDAQPGTATGSVYGDGRKLQGAPSQLPAGGYLNIQALGLPTAATPAITGGGDIEVVSGADYSPASSGLSYGQDIGFGADGAVVIPVRPAGAALPTDRLTTIVLDADAISGMGLSQLGLETSGKLTVAAGANIDLAPGGAFTALAGGVTTIDGAVNVPAGSISLATANLGGSVFAPATVGPGAFDIVVNGLLNASGRWVNDFNAQAGQLVGSAYTNGGQITLAAAPRVYAGSATANPNDPDAPSTIVDASGSILINKGALLDVSGGGYVAPSGALNLTAKGGSVSLYDQATYFQLVNDTAGGAGGIPGFRVTDFTAGGSPEVSVNPASITARVSIADGSIQAHGFGGGGTFTLSATSFQFGPSETDSGAALPLDFFSKTGFSAYNITTYKTDLIANAFNNGLGGYNAVLATDVVTLGAGETLKLEQSIFSPNVSSDQINALQSLATGSSLYSVLTPAVPKDAWDQKAVSLTLGGLTELHIDAGAAVRGAAGSSLTVGQLFNEGMIRIAGGTVKESEVLPGLYSGELIGGIQQFSLGVHDLSDVFTVRPDGTISETARNALKLTGGGTSVLTNGQVASQYAIYLLGDLDAGEGVRLAPGSVIDLSGAAIVNPLAKPQGSIPSGSFTDGTVIAGGSLSTLPAFANGGALFHVTYGNSVYLSEIVNGAGLANSLNAEPDSRIDLAGASATFDRPVGQTAIGGTSYGPTLIWSDGGSLSLGSGGTITGADIKAGGGAPLASGGVLTVLDPVLYQDDPATPTFDAISAYAFAKAGFDTFVAQGSLTSNGDVKFKAGRGVFVESPTLTDTFNLGSAAFRDQNSPVIGSGGVLEIDAPYIALDGAFQSLSTPKVGAVADNSLILRADNIDVTGAVLFDRSVGEATLSASGDVRLIGVEPWQQVFNLNPGSVASSLGGQLAVNGNLTIKAAQVYPTTGTSYSITSSAPTGVIAFERAKGATPATPYSAGGALLVQASSIDQGGVIRVPLGALTLGGDKPIPASVGSAVFAPATDSLVLEPGSITSVSADGLVIPYGTTTDQIEWYFTPTNANPLTAPPAGVLNLGGGSITVNHGAKVDLKGGGDVYAYEFVSGVGGTRDVLDRYNTDQFSADNGCQYADCRQVYAIVPGLSNAGVAAYDPIYSANYASLYAPAGAGQQVYLSAAPGLAAGWYTLLPAQYALLPGGMRVVEDTGAATPPPTGGTKLADGTVVTSGAFGASAANTREAGLHVFDIQSQAVINTESHIALTYGDKTFAADAAAAGKATPQLPIDAGRLILNPVDSLVLGSVFETTPAAGGRGAEVDLGGDAITIVASAPAMPSTDGGIVLTAQDVSNLHAASLFIGGTRTDEANGDTSLDITTTSITVEDGARLVGPEMILATDGKGANLDIQSGASIIATGAVTGESTGDYVIDGLATNASGTTSRVQSAQGGFLRVSNGPARLVSRLDADPKVAPGTQTLGAAKLRGASVELNSGGDLSVDPAADISATSIGLGAAHVAFAPDADGLQGLVITPALRSMIGKAQNLTIQSTNAITFTSGAYRFGNLQLDAPGLADTDGGKVAIDAGVLVLSNAAAAGSSCGAACGDGAFALTASEIDFGAGTIDTFGASQVSLNASKGVFDDGPAVLDTGDAALAIDSPFIGDRGGAAPGADAPSLTLTTTGDVSVTSPKQTTPFKAPPGAPGAALDINGRTISVSGAQLRATAGALRLDAAAGIAISDGALLATPGYAKVFGDAADPTTVSAPGGLLSLTANHGDVAISADSRLSVGGGQGAAGTLALFAEHGRVYAHDGTKEVSLASTFEAVAPDGGASLTLATGGSFDLSAFVKNEGSLFTGDIAVQTGKGDLTLGAKDVLNAASVQLVADGGAVNDAGSIDTSGVNGGDVSLYGAGGVHLSKSASIRAQAKGYGASDTRQAHGGDVVIGVDGDGAIRIDQGATIDVAALNTENRLVPMSRTTGTYYTYVSGDVGGTVTFRAPVIDAVGGETVKVSVQGDVAGASSIVLEGYKRFDLAALGSDPDYVGVAVNNGQAVLDLAAAASGKINPLTDYAPGTLVQFIQDYAVSADYGALGGLADQANFHARPGVELDYSGDIVLKSNWNLGAGVVDVAGAVSAGLMSPLATSPGQYAVNPGDEGLVFANYTKLTYRVGAAVNGEPGVLSFRAGGALDIKGTITDGFFAFRDQTDPTYLSYALGGGDRVYQGYLNPTCTTPACADIDAWSPTTTPASFVSIVFPGRFSLGAEPFSSPAPYSAAANSPAALGALAGNTGDPVGSAQLFPLVGAKAVDSWSYQLVAGADLAAPGGGPSVDPLAVAAGSRQAVTVEGFNSYSYRATAGVVSFADSLNLQAGQATVTADEWYQAFVAANPGLDTNAYTSISYGSAGAANVAVLSQLAQTFFASHPGEAKLGANGVSTTLSLAAKFMVYVSANFDQIAPNYAAPAEHVSSQFTYATAPTLVRTGTGAIQVAASGDIDLRNGATPSNMTVGGVFFTPKAGAPQFGGVALYTAGHLAVLGQTTATDTATGAVLNVDLASNQNTSNLFGAAAPASYAYGQGSGYAGILIANPVYAEGGGDVSLDAGLDVLGRRDTTLEAQLGGVGRPLPSTTPYSWIGTGDQPWRTGAIAGVANVEVNPQLFAEGIGTLGGGDITVRAGRDVSDLSLVATDSIATADVGGVVAGAQPAALAAFGGGDVTVVAGGDILGGRLDVASGQATLVAYRDVASAGSLLLNLGASAVPDDLRVRLSDATIDILAGGTVALQGIAALGVNQGATQVVNNLDSEGFFSPTAALSIVADGQVDIRNAGADVVTANTGAAGYTNSAVYPGTFQAVSFTGGLDIAGTRSPISNTAAEVVLYPSPTGTLTLLAAGDIAPVTIDQEDADPSLLPGVFSKFNSDGAAITSGRTFLFPAVLPNTSDVVLDTYHNADVTHAGDPTPNRIVAGGDIVGMTLSAAKQTRIDAGQDILNMVFLGQNVGDGDVTRIVAGRDITATTDLVNPVIAANLQTGDQLPAVQGDTFVLGGPGAFFLEAGRNAGPFLNSAVTNGFSATAGGGGVTSSGVLTFGGGIQTVGNQWNPFLSTQGADIYTEFGVAKGEDFAALTATYLSPANFANLPDYEFQQTTNSLGAQVADRNVQLYTLSLVDWMRSIAPDIIARYNTSAGVTTPGADAPALVRFAQQLQSGATVTFAQALAFLPQVADRTMPLIPWLELNQKAALTAAYGTLDVNYQQAFDTFQGLGALTQRQFLIKDVYFNELAQTSIPTSPSYLVYSRGYQAVNTLFPGTAGYTQNSLAGGPAGASTLIHTGNLDLRLATLQSAQGGDVFILGPGGEVLAGSTVSTAAQASRRAYLGGALYSGSVVDAPLASTITKIPTGYEGVLTLRGGNIDSFTDADFLLNQSRAFTEQGGDVTIWSSNADVNAGQGPRTSVDIPPVVVLIDQNAHSEINTGSAVSGAGIAAFQPDPTAQAPDVFLIAPRGTVDAGDAGVRSAGNLFVAAFAIANATGFQAQGATSGVQSNASVNIGAQAGADAASAAAAQAAQAVASSQHAQSERPLIIVDVLGYLADECGSDQDDQTCSEDPARKKQP